MEVVDNKTFLSRLDELFQAKLKRGSIWITEKRLTYDGGDALPNGQREYPCLIRVTDGKKVKFSTRVDASALAAFHAQYGAALKASMIGNMRKRDKKREKERAERIAALRKKLERPVLIEGPKRGNRRRERQRRVKASAKIAEKEKKRSTKADNSL